MEDFLSNPITWIVVYAASEIVGESKLKSNSIIRLIFQVLMQLKPKSVKEPERKIKLPRDRD